MHAPQSTAAKLALAISDPDAMNEREYDLLTTAPQLTTDKFRSRDSAHKATSQPPSRSVDRRRAINRAPAFIQKLYIDGLIEPNLAASLGPDKGRRKQRPR